jgi:outer membrane lipoprotein-sorting protein
MKNSRQYLAIFTLILGLFSIPALAQKQGFKAVTNETNFRQKMEATTLATESIVSDFEQEKQLSFMEEPIVSSGQFFFKKNQKIRWEYLQPFSYIVILNGSDLLINDEGNKNEMDLKGNKTFQEINATITNSLQGDVWGTTKDFTPILLENEALYLIQLTPQTDQMSEYLTKIEVYFNKKNHQLEQVILFENGEDFTKIAFKNQLINSEIEDALFKL